MKVRDVLPGTHYRRPEVNDGTRELVKLRRPVTEMSTGYPMDLGEWNHFSYDPKNHDLVCAREGTSDVVLIEAKRGNGTTNHVELTDDEVRLLEFLTANLEMDTGEPHALHRKFLAFGLSGGRKPFHVTLGGQSGHLEAYDNPRKDGMTIVLRKDS